MTTHLLRFSLGFKTVVLSLIFTQLFTQTTFANTPAKNSAATTPPATLQETSWRVRAEEENKKLLFASAAAKNEVKNELTAEQAARVGSGYLTLVDPFEEQAAKSWKWGIGLSLKSLQPQGTAFIELGGTTYDYSLGSSSSTIAPTLSLQARVPVLLSKIQLAIAPQALITYVSHEFRIPLPPAGYEGRLNHLITEARLPFIFSRKDLTRFSLFLAPGLGEYTLAQTSSESLAQFSQKLSFTSLAFGAIYDVDTKLQAHATLNNRYASGNSTLKLPQESLEAGVTYLW